MTALEQLIERMRLKMEASLDDVELLLKIIEVQAKALEEMQEHLCDSASDKTCSQMWYQDVIEEACESVDKLARGEGEL